MMESEFNSYSFEDDNQENEVVLGESGRFVFSKKRIYGRMHFLKRPSVKYKDDLITIESLRKEFAIGYALDHPNIVKYHRLDADTLFEEYLDGKSLREMIQGDDPRLGSDHFLQKLCVQFLDVLRYLRMMGVVHNDIKPENVIVTRIGDNLKLVDFNCAQSSDNDILGGFSSQYKAPEQGKGAMDAATDLYQVGKVMEELCGRVGCLKGWKRFIEGATAVNPKNRISLEDAARLIPGQNRVKKLTLIFLPLIILGVAAVITFIPRTRPTETVTVPEEKPVEDTVAIESVSEPVVEKIRETPEKSVRNVKQEIQNKILYYTDSYYTAHLYPICREALENDDRRLTREEELELQNAIEEAYRAAMDYGDKLSAEYPAERSYIEKESLQSFEMKISGLLLKVYPSSPVQSGE